MNSPKTNPEDLPFAVLLSGMRIANSGQSLSPSDLRSKDVCPECRCGLMEYNGMLNLECTACGYTQGGCFT